ncbi:MAG: AbrB/MazE/SpoVT family DNA-binding domain-containing protein [Promethearchaeota archaeon]
MVEILGTSKMTRGYQISVPREVREQLGLKVGEHVAWAKEGDRIIVSKVKI